MGNNYSPLEKRVRENNNDFNSRIGINSQNIANIQEEITPKTGELKQSLIPMDGWVKCDGSSAMEDVEKNLYDFLLRTNQKDSHSAEFVARYTSTNIFSKIKYLNGRYVAIASGKGIICYSNDGIEWNSTTYLSQTFYTNDIIFDGKNYIIIGLAGASKSYTIYYSEDFVNWKTSTLYTHSDTSISFNSIAYNGTTYVAGGSYSLSSSSTTRVPILRYSSDLINWTNTPSNTTETASNVTYGNGIFVTTGINGSISTSTNGINWVSRTSGITNTINSVVYANGMFIASCSLSNILLTSTDGTTWNKITMKVNLPSPEIYSYSITSYGDGVYFMYINTREYPFIISKNLIDWFYVKTNSVISNNLGYGIRHNDMYIVSVGYTLSTSKGGILLPNIENTYIKS